MLGVLIVFWIDTVRERHRRLLVLNRIGKAGSVAELSCDAVQLELFDKSKDDELVPEPNPEPAWWRKDSEIAAGLTRKSA